MNGLERLYHTFFDLSVLRSSLPELLKTGLLNTVLIAAIAAVIGALIGTVLAAGLMTTSRIVRLLCRAYVNVFRGLPQIVSVYVIGAGLPLAGVNLFGKNTFLYAALAVGVAEAAYIAEILRSGFQSVPPGLIEATRSLGISGSRTMLSVTIPLGVRAVLPALTGQFIIVLKITSLVYLLGLTAGQRDLFAIAQDQASLGTSLTPLTAAGLVYLILTLPMTYAVNAWDRRLRAGPAVRDLELAGTGSVGGVLAA